MGPSFRLIPRVIMDKFFVIKKSIVDLVSIPFALPFYFYYNKKGYNLEQVLLKNLYIKLN